MAMEIQLSVIYLANETNDINDFDFFIRMVPTKENNIVAVSVVPRFSINQKQVKHIKFSVTTENSLNTYDLLRGIAQLKELANIVADIDLSVEMAQARLKDLILNAISQGE